MADNPEMKLSPIKMMAVGIALGVLYLGGSVAVAWRSAEVPFAETQSNAASAVLSAAASGATARPPQLQATAIAQVEAFCGDCHAVPNPGSFARYRWADEIKRGYEFYARSGRTDLDPPPPEQTLAYYLANAPLEPRFAVDEQAARPLQTRFRVEKRFVAPEGRLPEVSTLIWAPLREGGEPMLIAADMKFGQVVAIDPKDADAAPIILARLEHPGRIQAVSFSGDGSTEFLVADLGTYMPSEESHGRIVLLRRPPSANAFETIVLATGFARVADVRAADFDGDGKQDLLVAEFGWQRSGGIWLLRNTSEADGPLRFEREKIDHRPGTIHLPVHDFDEDGRPDFVALVGQEYEAVDLFLNRITGNEPLPARGANPFLRLGLWAGPDLTFGVSGLQLCDLNANGRMDMLVTSGDTWDNLQAVPTHGVHWLENRGELDFQYHRLTTLPGAYATTVLDVDGDRDSDIIAVTWLPPNVEPQAVAGGKLGSVVCLEQVEPGVFARHTLESGSPFYSSVVSGDFDNDGDPDFAVASGPMVAEDRDEKFYLAIWWNQRGEPAE